MTVAATTVIVFLIAYTAAGALLALNPWNIASWASAHDFWHRNAATFRAGGFLMAVSGPPILGFVVVEVLRSR